MFYFIVSFFIASWFLPYNNTEIDTNLKPYYNEYIEIVNQYCEKEQYYSHNFNLLIDTKNVLDSYELGACIPFPNAFNVYISKKWWDNNLSEDKKFALIVHELGHCQFDLPHFDDPNHFMYYADIFVSKKDVKSQLIEILKYKCDKD